MRLKFLYATCGHTTSVGITGGNNGQGEGQRIAASFLLMIRKEKAAMSQLMLEIPEALAQRLAWLAAEQKKSVEQVALERLSSLLEIPKENLSGSPAALRQAMHEPPHLPWEDVDELERAIAEGKLPVHQESVFDEREHR
jgi:hypothetical protein